MFEPVNQHVNFPELEEKVLEFWGKEKIFEKSLKIREDSDAFVFYDGPPFATGLPHYGHFVPGLLKDIIPRYKTMKGYHVDRRWGWDCHGLPVENEMEKELNLLTKKDILAYGIDKFNESCRSIVLRYTSEWERIISRSGRWVDFKNSYRTMDPYYMESIWWVFKTLWDKGLIYEGFKILPYCPRCATPLSNFEVNQGYKDVKDPAITIKFKSKDEDDLYYLAWTTTPWTLPSNLALAVGPEIKYVEVFDHQSKERYVLALARLEHYYKNPQEYTIKKRFLGKDIEGKRYIPLFPYFENISENAFKIVLGDYVSIEDGTGIVHTAPGFGEDDYNTGIKYNLPIVSPVDENGEFTEEVFDYKMMHVKKADPLIIEDLKKRNLLVKKETISHSYPHCWRCDSPLIYKSISTWFVKIEPIKQKMIESNQQINWVPEHIKEGRFGKWLEGARDWAISRNRFWGTPLPVWKCEDCGETLCIGSIEELEKLSGKKFNDIHKHFVDNIHFKCSKCGGKMTRIPEVLDCWFESGSMPYAQEHYPFENKEKFLSRFPADFIAEGLDQTRGWFYTLTVLAAALFGKPAFKNCIVNGLVLDEHGKKMSKRLKNYPEPMYIMDKYGADALRLYLVNSAVIRAEELNFSETGIKEIVKNILLPLWNSYSFFITYAIIDKWNPKHDIIENPEKMKNFSNELDRWIISSMQSLIKKVTEATESYKLYLAIPPIIEFIDILTNWYIRRSRRRFWKSENDKDKDEAYHTLYYILLTLSKVAAPYIPFITEAIYKNIKTEKMSESVHLTDYPVAIENLIDKELEKRMELIQKAVVLGRNLRTQYDLKVRQPLLKVIIIDPYKDELKLISDFEDLVKEELNVKEVIFSSEETSIVQYSAKPNFRKLGKILGSKISVVQKLLSNLTSSQIEKIIKGEKIVLSQNDFSYEFALDDITVERKPVEGLATANEGHITVALDTNITLELKMECDAREIINKIQNMRKEQNFSVTDRIKVSIWTEASLFNSIEKFKDYICSETLCLSLNYLDIKENEPHIDSKEWEINEYKARILVENFKN
ncbi:MAG: isoleucine--tRNA ligase [Exilispira sp.]|jgi:isoleucyl-tRNA synthetase|nr:isoleucine--tRNA ligase [Exilispira sp.]